MVVNFTHEETQLATTNEERVLGTGRFSPLEHKEGEIEVNGSEIIESVILELPKFVD